jgi:hypothetical protein
MTFNPLEHPVCLDFPLWMEQSAWAEHIPFAMFLIDVLRPRLLVELGTYHGVSYCAFCQAVKTLQIETKCYAVDTWQGDKHAGELEETILSKLQAHHDPLYADFSRLIQSTFDEALQHFSDGSIDLLHIDGFHTYEAVSRDFQTWLPKMSPRGIVLFHDINVRKDDFGVWKFWEETSEKYKHFTFLHGHGLGVLAVGEDLPEDLQNLFAADEKETFLLRKFFHELGTRIESVRIFHEQNQYIESLQTYERVVRDSRLMRAYRILKDEGVGSLLKKAAK